MHLELGNLNCTNIFQVAIAKEENLQGKIDREIY